MYLAIFVCDTSVHLSDQCHNERKISLTIIPEMQNAVSEDLLLLLSFAK